MNGRGIKTRAPEDSFFHSLAVHSPALIALFLFLCLTFPTGATTNTPTAAALAELTKPAKQIPFKEVIHATTHHRLLDFDTNNVAHRELYQRLTAAAEAALTNARAAGLFSARANEAGNHMESFVKAALKTAGLVAQTPVTASGRAQSTGYPDVEITGEAFSAQGLRRGNLISCKARVELKARTRLEGKVLAVDRETGVAVDITEQTAAKTALQNAAAELASRIAPKLLDGAKLASKE